MDDKEHAKSLAMFGAVAMIVTRWQGQNSSSEDLGGSFFDEEHEDLERFVQSVPKMELHVHLDGALDPYRLWTHLQGNPELVYCFPVEKELPWAKADEPPLPLRQMVQDCGSPIDYRHLCTCRRRYRDLRHSDFAKPATGEKPQGSLEDMLTCFEFFFPLIYDNFDLLEHLAFDFVQRQFEQRVIYTEVRYSPHLLAKDPVKCHKAVTRGLRKGCKKYNITVNQILCAINFNPEWSADVVKLAALHRNEFPCAVVGVDVAAGEDHFSPESPFRQGHFDMCQEAKDLGLNITIHAGETPNSAQNVQTAIEEYGAKRIGHAYRMTQTEQIMDLVREKNIHIEVCPTSSVETGGWKKTDWKDHPACTFQSKGIPLSLNSDDPAVFNTSLTWQYRIAMKKMGWDKTMILAMLENAIDAAFVGEDEKEALRKEIQEHVVRENPVFDDRVHYD